MTPGVLLDEDGQGVLFPAAAFQPQLPPARLDVGWVYVMHLWQRSGPDLWKIGHTVRSVQVRAREIACAPIVWWHGSEKDERALHRRFRHLRMSRSAEFFRRGQDIDQWILRQARSSGSLADLATLAEIFLNDRAAA